MYTGDCAPAAETAKAIDLSRLRGKRNRYMFLRRGGNN